MSAKLTALPAPSVREKQFRMTAEVLLPEEAVLRLPKPLMAMLLDLGERLLIPDSTTGTFKLNQPGASRIALALHDGDQEAADEWCNTLLAEYNEYVARSARRDVNDPVLAFIP